MKIIFYFNTLSIHQSAFLTALSSYAELTVVVEKQVDSAREKIGWQIPLLPDAVKILVNPSKSQLIQLIWEQEKDCIQFFSGISAFPMVKYALDEAIKCKLPAMVYLEPYDDSGIYGFVRNLKYRILAFKYRKSLKALFMIGVAGRELYRAAGFYEYTFWEWGYFTEYSASDDEIENSSTALRVVFVGNLVKRKNCLGLLKAVEGLPKDRFSIDVIGSGVQEKRIRHQCTNRNNIRLRGSLSNVEVRREMSRYDLLVLPSLYDGWGAVVNEALLAGTRVLASDRCGSACLIQSERQGSVFRLNEEGALTRMFIHELEKGRQTREQRNELRQWAKATISGEVAAKYFIAVYNHLYFGKAKPVAPWSMNR